MPGPLVLVTGAGGAVGPRIVEALHAAGCRVRTLSRHHSPDPPLREATQLIGDVTDTAAVAAATRDVQAVLHLAALLHGQAGASCGRAVYEASNVSGTATLLEAATHAGVARFVLFSTVAVYGRSLGAVHDEGSPTAPDTPHAETN